MASGYTVAGVETLMTIIDNFMLNKKNDFEDHFTREDISNFFNQVCSRYLHSFGQNFRGKKNYSDYNKREANLYTKIRQSKFFDSSNLIVDSGGFQISVGLLTEQESNILFEKYYQFLVDYNDVYDQAFILDIPPGPGCEIFKNFDQIYEKNLNSYLTAANLPDEIRKKIIYIHHFRTPKLWNIYTKILRDNDLYSKFDLFGTGGIVATSAGDSEIPCIIYVIPLIPLLNETIKHKRNKLDFHVLGGATYRDLFFYELFKYHVKKVHNIELNITYDSSGLFKGLMIGRYFCTLDSENKIRKVDIKNNNLDKRFKDELKIIDVCKKVCDLLSTKYGFKQLQITDSIYSPVTGTFYEPVKVYLMLYMLEFYLEIELLMKEKVSQIYPLYQSENIENFISKCEQVTRDLNQGKISRKQTSKSNSIIKSLDMLTNLDEDYCKHIVDRFLSKDEFINLTKEGQILTI
jgi:hypothetical protein